MRYWLFCTLIIFSACATDETHDCGTAPDVVDGGVQGSADLGEADLSSVDMGSVDLGASDLGSIDQGAVDLGAVDLGAPDTRMSFFVTSVGNGANGGNFGGLTGADSRCQNLAARAGAGDRTWRAYLSTHPSAGGALVHARDRIGAGPWFNFDGTMIASDIDALHQNGIASALTLDEQGASIPSDEHDIVTGSQGDGTAFETFPGNPDAPSPTCFNWTSNADDAYVYVGHNDWDDTARVANWNSAHDSLCSEAGLRATAGAGRLYCFAID